MLPVPQAPRAVRAIEILFALLEIIVIVSDNALEITVEIAAGALMI